MLGRRNLRIINSYNENALFFKDSLEECIPHVSLKTYNKDSGIQKTLLSIHKKTPFSVLDFKNSFKNRRTSCF